jgi:hypothetical protein
MEDYTGKVLNGKEFNKLFIEKKYKITNEKEIHYGLKYKTGLNEDIVSFNPKGSCKEGGIYFTNYSNIFKFIDFGNGVREVIIPDDALVYIEEYKFKTDKLILKEKILYEKLFENDYEICKLAVQQNRDALRYVKNQT